MRGRRRNERYPLSVPLEGGFAFFQDLTIERHDKSEVVALSDDPASFGQELTLDLMDADSRTTVVVRVTEKYSGNRQRASQLSVAAGHHRLTSAQMLMTASKGGE